MWRFAHTLYHNKRWRISNYDCNNNKVYKINLALRATIKYNNKKIRRVVPQIEIRSSWL